MSNHLAVATVSATLAHMLQNAVQGVPGARVVSSRPERQSEDALTPKINVFLYQIKPNAAFRNQSLPTRSADGKLIQRPRTALDLDYLLTFSGDEARLAPQVLMGLAATALEAEPILGPEVIRRVVAGSPDGFLENSNLDQQPEPIRLVPVDLSLEELSKLWSVLIWQVPYGLSMAYRASVVLMDANLFPAPALPLRRTRVKTVAPRVPQIREIVPTGAPFAADLSITLHGKNLSGGDIRVAFGERETDVRAIDDGTLKVGLPAGVQAGVQAVRVVHRLAMGDPPEPHNVFESNPVAFALQPSIIDAPRLEGPSTAGSPPSVSIRVVPEIGPFQRVALLLNEWRPPPDRPPHGYTIPIVMSEGLTDRLSFAVPGVAPATYLVRVRVDDVASPLRVGDDMGEFSGPKVTIQ